MRVQDFDALALTADTWIEARGDLQGVVLHARGFPGWENFGSFLRHAQFVRDHHRKVIKVALSADGKLAGRQPADGRDAQQGQDGHEHDHGPPGERGDVVG